MKAERQELRPVQANLLGRPRYMCREWNPRKLNMHRTCSVPNLKLLPATRPLFECRCCHFSNDRYHICLFCGWTSKEAEDDFQRKIQRRTLSSPYRLEFFSLHRHVSPVSLRTAPGAEVAVSAEDASLDSNLSCVQQHASVLGTAPDNPDSGSAPVPSPTHQDTVTTQGRLPDKANPAHSDWTCGIDVVKATCLPPSGSPSSSKSALVCDDQDAYRPSLSRIGGTVSPCATPHYEEQVSRPSSDGVDRSSTPNGMSFTTKLPIAMKSSRPVALRVLSDASNRPKSRDASTSIPKQDPPIDSSQTSPSTQRSLRHKKRHSMLHFSAPPSAYIAPKSSSSTMNSTRPQSHPTASGPAHAQSSEHSPYPSASTSTRPQSIPITKILTHNRSQSQPNVHLGNRERPYYSAIRKGMSTSVSSRTSMHDLSSTPPSTSTSAAASQSAFSPMNSRAPSPAFAPSSAGATLPLFSPSPIPWSTPPPETGRRASWLFDSTFHDDDEEQLPTPTFSPPSYSPLHVSTASAPAAPPTPSKSLFHVPFRRNHTRSSRPSSPHSGFTDLFRSTTNINNTDGATNVPPMSKPPKSRRNTTPAFSKKEEMELRMALAREVGHTGVSPDEGYVYREKRSSLGSLSGEAVKTRVRKLKHGIKSLVKSFT
ncbi:hypothetical protein VKT23_008272 [Stygiomarasmius scandens]|uniref:Uncharacterized protein n=1 Tax=Marasmiellus scandens TaxID=2682957 RepID=A0ABR1JM11_9AGAR